MLVVFDDGSWWMVDASGLFLFGVDGILYVMLMGCGVRWWVVGVECRRWL